MGKTATTRYDAAEHLRTPDEMAAYLEPALKRRAEMPRSSRRRLEISLVLKAWRRSREMRDCRGKAFIKHSPGNAARASTPSSRSLELWG